MKYGCLRQDDDGHWYLVEEDRLDEFDKLSEEMEGLDYMDNRKLFDRFNKLFSDDMISNPYSFLIPIDQECL